MDHLDETQLAALNQLRDLTAGADDEVSISVLESVDWDVQRAVEMIFGAGGFPAAPPPAPEPEPRANIEQFDIDDSEQGLLETDRDYPAGSGGKRIARPHPNRQTGIIAFLAYPFQLLSSLFRFVFGILRIPVPRLPFLSLNFLTPRRHSPRAPTGNGRGGPDLWVRELEEETGAVCLSHARSMVSTGVSSSVNVAGPSALSYRADAQGVSLVDGYDGKLLPDFTLGSYEDTLRKLQKELRIGCVILVSEEHDDDAEFKNTTLTNQGLISLFAQHNFVVWGGDVRDIEAYSAAQKLQATTYPFVAFLAQQPQRGSSRSSTASSLTVLSRHQGSSSTTPAALIRHIEDTLLPRVNPYLNRIKNHNDALQQERLLRLQQDQAFAQSAQRDTERILKKMEEEKQQRLQAEREAQLLLEEQQRLEREEITKERVRSERSRWRKWCAGTAVGREPPTGISIALKFPDGKRIVRRFSETDTVSSLYAVVVGKNLEAEGVLASLAPADVKPGADREEVLAELLEADPAFWGFNLTLAYPRAPIPWAPNSMLKDVEVLKGGGAQVLVNLVGEETRQNGRTPKSEDGYDTESDED